MDAVVIYFEKKPVVISKEHAEKLGVEENYVINDEEEYWKIIGESKPFVNTSL